MSEFWLSVFLFGVMFATNFSLCALGFYCAYTAKNKAHELLGLFFFISALCIDILCMIYW